MLRTRDTEREMDCFSYTIKVLPTFLSDGDVTCRSFNFKLVLREKFLFLKGREIRNWSVETFPTVNILIMGILNC